MICVAILHPVKPLHVESFLLENNKNVNINVTWALEDFLNNKLGPSEDFLMEVEVSWFHSLLP